MTRIYAYLAAFLALIGSGLGLWFKGRADANEANKMEQAQDYIETRKRIDKANDEITGDDPAVLRDWLSERGRR